MLEWLNVILPLAAPLATAWVAIYTIQRQGRLSHTHWIRDQRLAAYADFLSQSRSAYEVIAWRAQDLVPGAGAGEDQSPDMGLGQIESQLNAAKNAEALVQIVGPEDVAQRASEVVARLRVDRLFYSPTRGEQLLQNPSSAVQLAVEAGPPAFAETIRRALAPAPRDISAYEKAHSEHRLEEYWAAFIRAGQHVLRQP